METLVQIPTGSVALDGDLRLLGDTRGIVVFADGSGSGRLSPANRHIAEILWRAGLSTLLIDLLSKNEQAEAGLTGHTALIIRLLANRLAGVTGWLKEYDPTRNLQVGYLGSSTGAAVALVAASQCPDAASAIVSHGGRPDLAGSALSLVKAPTLLIAAGHDFPLVAANRDAIRKMPSEKELVIIPGVTHLPEGPGALEGVALLAARWFLRYLGHAAR